VQYYASTEETLESPAREILKDRSTEREVSMYHSSIGSGRKELPGWRVTGRRIALSRSLQAGSREKRVLNPRRFE